MAKPLEFHRREFKAMGSPCEIQLYASTRAEAQNAIEAAIGDIERLEQRYSRYRASSFLSEINGVAAKGGTIAVDGETAHLLDYAAACYDQSDGLFDITSGVLRKAWKFDRGALPDESLIRSLLEKMGWEKLRWRAPVLEFPVAGIEIDFGGVVKEYAVDRAATLCQEAGIHHGVINLGGDLKIIGPHFDGSPWRVGIRHPRNREGVLQSILLHKGALATSGDYERCIVLNGKRYGHILNPKTGWPVHYMASVSVAAELCVLAGSASTVAMLKEEDGPAWLSELGLQHVWVDTEGHVGGTLRIAS